MITKILMIVLLFGTSESYSPISCQTKPNTSITSCVCHLDLDPAGVHLDQERLEKYLSTESCQVNGKR